MAGLVPKLQSQTKETSTVQHIQTQQSKQYDVISQHEQFDTATERHRVVIVPSHGLDDAIVARRQ